MKASQSNQANHPTENDKTLNCLVCSKPLPSFALLSGTVYCSPNCTPCKLRDCPTCASLAEHREPWIIVREKAIDLACGKKITVYYDRTFRVEESEEHFAARTVLVTDALSGLSKEDGLLFFENHRNAAALPERLLSLYYLFWNLEPKNLTCFVCSTTIDLKNDPLLYKCGRGEHLAHSQCLTLKRFHARKIDPMALYDCPICHAPDSVCKIEGCAACKALRQFTTNDLVLFQHFLEIVLSPHYMFHSCTEQVSVGLITNVYGGETVEHLLARAIMVHSLAENISDFDRKRLGSIEDGGLEYKPLPDRFREIWYLIANSREEPGYVDYAHRWNGPIKRDTHAFCD